MSLTAAWGAAWSADPTRVVLRAPAEDVAWTAAELDERTATAAAALQAGDVQTGDRVLLSCTPSAATVVAYIAILRAGAVVVAANTGYTTGELAHIESIAQPTHRITDANVDLADLPAPLTNPCLDSASSDAPAMLGFTSGTTGKPKAAQLSHGNLLSGARAVVQAWEWSSDDVLLHALPMFHMHGLGVGINGTFTAGAALTVLPAFDPTNVADQATQASMFFGVPTMYSRLADARTLDALSRLRLIVSGSAPLPVDLFTTIADQVGQPPLERYGMTETVMLTGNPLRGERRPGSVGVSMPDVDIRLGADDVVEVRGPNVFGGYLGVDPGETFTADGWFPTGDIGRVDDDGYWHLVGRTSDLIITGGYNVYPREIEDVLRDVPGVLDVAVIGRASREWGEEVTAVIVGDAAVDALRKMAADSLAPYKRPKDYRFVEGLPRNAMGKVDRRILGEQIG
jgi:malonyl-CoA/methylmalonyl-CoA synthetase